MKIINTYAGYLNNENDLLKSASGGIATALSIKCIEDGGVVFGVTYANDFKSIKYKIIKTIDELECIKSSKYIDVDLNNNTFDDVKKFLLNGTKVLFFGLPCKIFALKFYLKKEFDNLYCCELVCDGPLKRNIHVAFIDYLEKKYKSKIVDFNARKKIGKWMPPYLYVKFENGKKYIREYYTSIYGLAFGICANDRCYNCNFKGNNGLADIQIGDFWGASKKDSFYNKLGTSCIFIKTTKGDELIKLNEYIYYENVDYQSAISNNPSVLKSKSKSYKKDQFEKNFSKKGLIYAYKKSTSFKIRIKNFIPFKIMFWLKNKISYFNN